MAPKAGAISPKGKPPVKSALGAAGASMLGGGASPKAEANGSAAAAPPPKSGASGPSPRSSGLGKAGSQAMGSARSAGGTVKEPLSPGAPPNGSGFAKSESAGAPANGSGVAKSDSAGAPAAKAPAPAAAEVEIAAPAAPAKSPEPAAEPVAKVAAAEPAPAEKKEPPSEAARGKSPAGYVSEKLEDVAPEALLKFHSAIRWGKPWADVEESADGIAIKAMVAAKDPKNGNQALHIAAQNGHLDLVKSLLEAGGPVSGQNNKGQTPLHMSVEYDMYFVSKLLIDNKADKELANEDGNKAINGIDGGKSGNDAWDNPVTILKAANTAEDLEMAFAALEKALAESPEIVAKDQLIMSGMQKKKAPTTSAIWDHKKFMGLAAKF